MQLKDFQYVRVGSGYPAALDVYRVDTHETHGVLAVASTHRSCGEQGFVQLRQHATDKRVALITVNFDNLELPADWKDSVVLWDSRSDTAAPAQTNVAG